MKKRIISAIISAVLCASLFAGCGSANAGGAAEAPKAEEAPAAAEADTAAESDAGNSEGGDSGKDITVNVGDQAAFFLVKVAEKKGFFEEEFAKDGITIHSEIFAKMGPAIIEAMAAGDVDLSIV